MTDQQQSQSHPLDAVDDWDCYDQHIAERNKLTAAKREAEDGFIKTIIQLSSAIALAVPGVLALNSEDAKQPSLILIFGIATVGVSLLLALSEQFLSSIAYEKQLDKTDAYYTKKSSDLTAPKVSSWVKFCLAGAFAAFLLGVFLVSLAFLTTPWRETVAQSPTPPARPTPPVPPTPTPKHDSPGRSVPPTPPPSPPSSPRK